MTGIQLRQLSHWAYYMAEKLTGIHRGDLIRLGSRLEMRARRMEAKAE